MKFSSLLMLGLIVGLNPVASYADSLGVMGNVYEIKEEDAVDYLKRRFKEMEDKGEVDVLRKKAIKTVENSMRYPEPIAGIKTAKENSTHYYNPTYVLPKDALDAQGRVVIPKGTSVNPLMHSSLSRKYLFIDARDEKQIKFAKELFDQRPGDKIVLTGGSWVELSKKLKTQVYYDQSGYLTRTFGITNVPSVVSQDGLRIKIEAFAL